MNGTASAITIAKTSNAPVARRTSDHFVSSRSDFKRDSLLHGVFFAMVMKKIKQKSCHMCDRIIILVREMRLELTRRLTHAPQTCLSTYSSTLAYAPSSAKAIIAEKKKKSTAFFTFFSFSSDADASGLCPQGRCSGGSRGRAAPPASRGRAPIPPRRGPSCADSAS